MLPTDIRDIRLALDTPLRREDATTHLNSYLPGLFGPNAPATVRDAVFAPEALYYRTFGTLKNPRVALRVQTGQKEIDNVYIRLNEDFGHQWVCDVGAHVLGGFNFGLRWEGERGVSEASSFQLHWIGHTPKIFFNLHTGLCTFTNFWENVRSQTVPMDDLVRLDDTEVRKLQLDGNVAVDHLGIDAQRRTIAADLTRKDTGQQLLHLEVPLSLEVDLDGVGYTLGTALDWPSMERIDKNQGLEGHGVFVIYPPSCTPL